MHFERRKRASESQVALFNDIVPDLLGMYRMALSEEPTGTDGLDWHCKRMAVIARLSIWGTDRIMESYDQFAEYVGACVQGAVEVDEAKLRSLLSQVTYEICCVVHGERPSPSNHSPAPVIGGAAVINGKGDEGRG